MSESHSNPPSSESSDGLEDEPQTLIEHLTDLRSALLRMSVAILVLFVAFVPFGRTLFSWAAKPFSDVLPENTSLIATEVISGFLVPFKLSFFAAVFVAMPYVLYQLWGFIAPGLYQREKRIATPLLMSSIALFYLGVMFVYYVVMPLAFGFIVKYAPDTVQVTPDISHYLSFMIAMFLTFGLAFEIPVAIVLLVWMGVSDVESLSAKRPYILIGAFTVGMFLTPPDIISQVLLAVPMYLLYELGLLMARRIGKRSDEPTTTA